MNRLSRAHERYRQTTDRQTTDGRAIAYSKREREFTFAKIGSAVWSREVSENCGHKKGKLTSRMSNISPCGRPTGAIALNFGTLSDIADVITPVKFYFNCFMGFGVVRLPILPFSSPWPVALATMSALYRPYTVTGLVTYLLS